jgi:DNA-3-methyladenine glycosylase II
MRLMSDATGPLPLRRNPDGFPGLARIVVGQQVSVASATAIWARCEQHIVPMSAATVVTLSPAALAVAGLSGPKIRTLKALADAIEGGFDLDALADLPAEDARAALARASRSKPPSMASVPGVPTST